MTDLLLVVALALAVSALCSVLEAVLLSVSHTFVAILEGRGHPAGRLLRQLRQRLDEPIAAILTLNTIAHTVGAALSGAIALRVFGSEWMAAFSAVLTLLILVLSEIVPKTLGTRYAEPLAPAAARILQVMVVVMRPVLAPLAVLNRLLGPSRHGTGAIGRDELDILAQLARQQGSLDEAEWRVVANVMRLREVRAREVMTPRTAIVALSREASPAEAQERFLATGFSRLPVYDGSIDQVVGILGARDLWRALAGGTPALAAVWREPFFVPGTRLVHGLLPEMRARRTKIAIVLDEFGGTAGLVTLDDLIESIVGDLAEEREVGPAAVERRADGAFVLDGALTIDEVATETGVELPAAHAERVGGLVFERLGRLPAVGDEVAVPGATLQVVAMDRRRVGRVLLRPAAAGEAAARP